MLRHSMDPLLISVAESLDLYDPRSRWFLPSVGCSREWHTRLGSTGGGLLAVEGSAGWERAGRASVITAWI